MCVCVIEFVSIYVLQDLPLALSREKRTCTLRGKGDKDNEDNNKRNEEEGKDGMDVGRKEEEQWSDEEEEEEEKDDMDVGNGVEY